MGWMKSAGLLLAGAAVGYLAKRNSGPQVGKDLELLPRGGSLDKFFSHEGTMAQFFDSKYGKPLQNVALKTLKFVSDVKAGMEEKEAEIQQKLEEQKKDIRPGSLDTWAQDRGEPLGAQEALEYEPEVIDGSASLDIHEQLRRNRLKRDKDLGDDFFTA